MPAETPHPSAGQVARLAGLAGALVVLLGLWAARGVLADPCGLVWGDTIDTVHHVWGHWWMLQPRVSPSLTTLVSFPFGEHGSLLAPIGTLLVQPVNALLGPSLSYNLLNLLYLAFAAICVGLCAHRLTGRPTSACVAAVALMVGRPLFVTIGMGTTEGVAVGWLALACWLALGWVRPGAPRWSGAAVGTALALSVIDDPYTLVLAVPLAVGFAFWRSRAPGWPLQIALAAAGGLLPTVGRLLWVGPGLGGNPGGVATVYILGLPCPYIDREPLRLGQIAHIVWPWPWPDFSLATAIDQARAGGGSFLGWGVLALALVGLWGRSRIPYLLAALCVLLSVGSLPFGEDGPPGPFLLLNALLGRMFAPLSQPQRFLPLCSASLAIAAGLGSDVLLDRIAPRRHATLAAFACALLAAEALFLGGPSIHVPSLNVRDVACFAGLTGGAVHTVARPGQPASALHCEAMRLQLAHRRPGTHIGIGGWRGAPRQPAFDALLAATDRAVLGGRREVVEALAPKLRAAGIRWLLVPQRSDAPWRSDSPPSCGGWTAVEVPPDRRPDPG